MQWFYADESDHQHEVSEDELRSLIAAGTVGRDTLVWNETMSDWQPGASVRPEWFGEEPGPPALTPAQRRAAEAPAPTLQTYQAPETDAVAVVSLVFGILGILCFQLFSVVAVITGHIAYNKAKRSAVPSGNKGMALAGLITGYLGIAILVVIVVIYGAAIAASIASGDFSSELE